MRAVKTGDGRTHLTYGRVTQVPLKFKGPTGGHRKEALRYMAL